MSDVMTMAIPSALKSACSHTSVGFTVAVVKPGNCCSVNKATFQAVTFEGTVRSILFSAVAIVVLVGVITSITFSITFSCIIILHTNLIITVSDI